MSISDHTRKLAKELGRKEPDVTEVFFRMQYNDSKSGVNSYAESTYKSFEDVKANTQESICSPIDNNHIEAVGGKNKRRIHGLGSHSVVHKAKSSPTPRASQDPQMFNVVKGIEERFQQRHTHLKQELKESRRKQNLMEQELQMLKQLISSIAHSIPASVPVPAPAPP